MQFPTRIWSIFASKICNFAPNIIGSFPGPMMTITTNVTNLSTSDQKLTRTCSHGPSRTRSKARLCETSVEQAGTSMQTMPLISSLPRRIRVSSTPERHQSSQTQNGNRSCPELAVNLDSGFSERYSAGHDPKVIQEIDDFTISTREVATSKTVKPAGDCFIAWNQAAAAITFAFPHRGKECIKYGSFAAFLKEHHHLIFNYDRAVRKRVALRWDILLIDLTEFGDLCVFVHATLPRTAVLTRIPGIVITVPYRRGDSNSWIWLTHGQG